MGMGLIGMGAQKRDEAMAGFGEVARLESQRNTATEGIKVAQETAQQQQKGMLGATGAAVGMMAGMGSAAMGAQLGMFAGPVGALAGGALGFVLGGLF